MSRTSPKYILFVALEKRLTLPMLVLSFVWVLVLVLELAYGLNPVLAIGGNVIWALFLFYFLLRLVTAERRISLLRKNWLFLLAILVSVLRFFPILQSFPVARAITATFGIQVIWIFASADQGLRSIRRYLGRRGVGYALALTFIVVFAGAAGMLHFEKATGEAQTIQTYPRALWWTAMQMTNIGSAYQVQTTGGRVLCLGISIYAATMFGYLTALFATFFIGRDAKDPKSEIASQKSVLEVREEVREIRRLLESAMHSTSGIHKG